MAIKKFKFDKLVRDKAVERMEQCGAHVSVKDSLTATEVVSCFKAKICEEAQEVMRAQTNEEFLNELADCAEVIDGFVNLLGFSADDLEKVRRERIKSRGAFRNGVVVDCVSADEQNSVALYCLNDPEKYPEVIE